jgi:hypothetical protein
MDYTPIGLSLMRVCGREAQAGAVCEVAIATIVKRLDEIATMLNSQAARVAALRRRVVAGAMAAPAQRIVVCGLTHGSSSRWRLSRSR